MRALYGLTTPRASQWTERRKDGLDSGRFGALLQARRQVPHSDEARRCLHYFQTNHQRMCYPGVPRPRSVCFHQRWYVYLIIKKARVRIKRDRKSLMIVPVRTGQFHPPDGATAIQRTLGFGEGRGIAAENPDVGVLGLLADKRRHHSGDASDIDLYDITRSFVGGASCRDRVLAFGRDQEFHEPGFWRGCHH